MRKTLGCLGRAVWLVALGGWTLGACGETADTPDAGDGGEDGGIDRCTVDDSRRRNTDDPDWRLTPGDDAATGFVCPKSDVDHYWLTIDAPGTILRVELSNNAPMSPVELCYQILPPAEGEPIIGGLCDHEGLDGVTELRGSHYLAESGTYFIEVRDEGGDDADERNAYALSLSQVVDPDPNEGNDDKDHATALTSSAEGAISYLGDQDWFRVDVGDAGQILFIDVTTTAATPVDLRYSLVRSDGATPINAGVQANGMSGPTALHDVLAVPGAGTYFLVVTDDGHDDADVEVGYRVQVQLQLNPDARDRSAPNDAPAAATPIASGAGVTDAYLASRADEDWYRIEQAGASQANPMRLEVELVVAGGSPIEPAVDLIVGDPDTPCGAGDACNLLSSTCNTGGCTSPECRNAKCASHECVAHEQRCAGAGACLPEGVCGLRHLILHGADWSTTGSPRQLHTVAPLYWPVVYVLVRDFRASAFDPQNAYQLTVRVLGEPDDNEPNGLYIPYADNEQEDDTRDWNYSLATPVTCQVSTQFNGYECNPITGFLAFRGDQDWFRLDGIPHEEEAAPNQMSTHVDWDLQFDWSFGGRADLYINYTLFGVRMGWNHEGPGDSIFGDDECAYICGEYQSRRPLYLRVQHSDRKKWDDRDPQARYTVTIRAERSCPLTCEYCEPTATDWACPTHANPCPSGNCGG